MLPINYLYWIFKPLLKISWRTAYNIKFIGKENINFKKPTLIVANHTNAVIDPIAIAVNVKRGIFFLARGDAFANNFLRWLLWQYHIIPIFRKEEGEGNLEKNQETFVRMFELFDKARPVLIFSEGKCIQEKTIRQFRKGTAHIAVDYANEKKDLSKLFIQPIGLNYHIYNKFRSDLIIHFGKPFTLQYLNLNNINTKESINTITKITQERLAECMVIQTETELYGTEIDAEEIIGSELFAQFKNSNQAERLFNMRVHLTQQLANKFSNENISFQTFRSKLDNLNQTLNSLEIPLKIFNHTNCYWLLTAVLLLLTFPVFVTGFLLNGIPFLLPTYIVKKKVKNPVFESTVRVVSGMFLFLIFYLCYLFLIPDLFDTKNTIQKIYYGLSAVIVAYFSGMFSYYWLQKYKAVKGFITFNLLKKEKKNALRSVQNECKEWLLLNLSL